MPLWRWVEMPIRPEGIEAARAILLRQAPRTRAFPGCLALTLYEGEGPTLYSLSLWESAEALEAYRSSALFRDFWETLRPYFQGKPRAVSVCQIATFN